MGVQDYTGHPKSKPPVATTESAKECDGGPAIGLIELGVTSSAFLFRVALPGIRKDQSNVQCEVQCDGKVLIQGIVTEGTGLTQQSVSVCQTTVQQMSSPGPFTISFNLPGPVDPRLFSPRFRCDGILEGVAVRFIRASDPANGWSLPA